VIGPALALAGAFALGFKVGEGLLALWNWANQAEGAPAVTYDRNNPETFPPAEYWPPGGIGFGVWQNVVWLYGGAGWDPWIYAGGVTLYAPPTPVRATEGQYWFVPAGQPLTWTAPGWAGSGLPFIEKFVGPETWPTPLPAGGGNPVDRSPVIDALNRARDGVGLPTDVPLAFIPPVRPAIPSSPSRAPVIAPAPIIAPAPAPAPAVPAGAPAPATRPGELPAITPGPGTAPAPAPQPSTFPQVDPLRPPVPISPIGVPVTPAPLPVPVTPPDIVTEGGLQIGDASQRPRPDLDSIARELGRQEQKLAGLLSGLGYPEAFDNLLDLLTSINGGTTYSLHPPCGTDANGDPLPPVEVIVPPTIGDNSAVIARLDALAMLLDEHKAMRQPICKGKPTGQPVTVTAVQLET
jgi:hypothetical protein